MAKKTHFTLDPWVIEFYIPLPRSFLTKPLRETYNVARGILAPKGLKNPPLSGIIYPRPLSFFKPKKARAQKSLSLEKKALAFFSQNLRFCTILALHL